MENDKKQVQTIILPNTLLHDQIKPVEERIQQELEQGRKDLLVDANNLETIDSFGIGFLVETLKRVRGKGGNLFIRGLRGAPLKSLRKSNLDMLFVADEITDTAGEEKGFPARSHTGQELKFSIRNETKDDVCIFHLSGILCFRDAARKFKQELLFAVSDQKKVVFNFEKLKYLDSLSINEIVVFYRTISSSGGEIRFCNANDLIRDIFKRQGIDQFIHGYQAMDDALKGW